MHCNSRKKNQIYVIFSVTTPYPGYQPPDCAGLYVARDIRSYQQMHAPGHWHHTPTLSLDLTFALNAQLILSNAMDQMPSLLLPEKYVVVVMRSGRPPNITFVGSREKGTVTITCEKQWTFPQSKVLFATSDQLDNRMLSTLHKQYRVPIRRFESIEEMWGVSHGAELVLTTRYHPAVAAHRVGTPVEILHCKSNNRKEHSANLLKLDSIEEQLRWPLEAWFYLVDRAFADLHRVISNVRPSA